MRTFTSITHTRFIDQREDQRLCIFIPKKWFAKLGAEHTKGEPMRTCARCHMQEAELLLFTECHPCSSVVPKVEIIDVGCRIVI